VGPPGTFLFITISLFAGFFSCGASAFLYLQHRTRILYLVLLFLFSLILINSGFWIDALAEISTSVSSETALVLMEIVSLPGLLLNVIIVPYLVAALISRPIRGRMKTVLSLWDVILLAAGLAYPFAADPELFATIITIQLVLTIFVSLTVLYIKLKTVPRLDLRRSLQAFFLISALFLVLLIPDILVFRFAIEELAFLNNASLPLYFIALNIGSFIFARRFLSADPLMEGGKVTSSCRANYQLTNRETEIIENLLKGKTNQELADQLFISRKTVENHLHKVYQKMSVKNRVQLVQTLRDWGRE